MISLKYFLCYITFAILTNAETTYIKVLFLSYDKSNITIAAGDTVQWSWLSSSHSVTQGVQQGSCDPITGGFDSSVLDTGSNFSVVFSKPGIYYYYSSNGLNCRSGMVGEINVGTLNNGVLTLPPRPKFTLDVMSTATTTSISLIHIVGAIAIILVGYIA
ncbi:hypothetical protein K493DRAFT_392187 [Basidiobolus meristosporus CBS 931.73]|uniref:Blue (type 1) copper domain-containing protein n=1 Tax=Basidiobolus meristosporus CBS 931.73 TaxID=1314790 RepID=A0A1Y1YQB8_9FUNG|nr:hypothetical protein K493DRAFT_392187 [Basidiobolus meristosporus CBS 931.73]|eukprot:ORY00218.1 hypothetical protein K493DRAFT_392187 [Basidiobolus meristosporus CBS 931.73]